MSSTYEIPFSDSYSLFLDFKLIEIVIALDLSQRSLLFVQ